MEARPGAERHVAEGDHRGVAHDAIEGLLLSRRERDLRTTALELRRPPPDPVVLPLIHRSSADPSNHPEAGDAPRPLFLRPDCPTARRWPSTLLRCRSTV